MEIKELQELVTNLKALRDEYDAKKRDLETLGSQCDSMESTLMTHLQENDMKSFKVDGVASISISERMTVQTPKTNDDKAAFFKWLGTTKGDDVMINYMTINSNSLNSLIKAEYESLTDDQKLLFQVPGLQPAALSYKLSVRKA